MYFSRRLSLFLALLIPVILLVAAGCSDDDGALVNQGDSTPPTLTSSDPADGAVDVSVGTTISATFSETMDATTITNMTFAIDNGVTGTVATVNPVSTFTPSTNLAHGTTYMAVLSTGIKDDAGNPLAAQVSWSFTTASLPSAIVWGGYAGGLRLIDPNGSNQNLWLAIDSIQQTTWSPDKSKCAFIRVRPYGMSDLLMVIDMAGEVDTLGEGGSLGHSPWSPDGSKLVYGTGSDIYTISSTGGTPTLVLASASQASFLTNDRVVCLHKFRDFQDSTMIVSLAITGGELDSLAYSPSSGKYFQPTVSAARDKIAFAFLAQGGNHDYNNQVYVMNTDGSGKLLLGFAGDGYIRGIDFNYDGTKLLIVPDQDDQTRVWTMNTIGGAATPIACANARDSHSAVWSPTDNRIVFLMHSGGLGIVNEAHTACDVLAYPADAIADPDW